MYKLSFIDKVMQKLNLVSFFCLISLVIFLSDYVLFFLFCYLFYYLLVRFY